MSVAGRQGELQRDRMLLVTAPTATPTQPPASTEPHFVMSPRAPVDLPTTGFMFFLENSGGAVAPTDAGFPVNIWKRGSASQRWALLVTIAAIPADVWADVCNVNASEIYFEIGVADDGGPLGGDMVIHFEELGS